MSPLFFTQVQNQLRGRDRRSLALKISPLLLIKLCWEAWLRYDQKGCLTFFLTKLTFSNIKLPGKQLAVLSPCRVQRTEHKVHFPQACRHRNQVTRSGGAEPCLLRSLCSTHHSDWFPLFPQGVQGQRPSALPSWRLLRHRSMDPGESVFPTTPTLSVCPVLC